MPDSSWRLVAQARLIGGWIRATVSGAGSGWGWLGADPVNEATTITGDRATVTATVRFTFSSNDPATGNRWEEDWA